MNAKNKYPDRYETHNISCAGFLIARGHILKEIETLDGGRKIFHFPPEALNDAVDYWDNKATIDPRKMTTAIGELKQLMFNGDEKDTIGNDYQTEVG